MNLPSYGICPLSIVPVRFEPSNKSELGTQLLFGDAFTVLKFSEDKKWAYIENTYDAYRGWIDAKQYKEINRDYFDEWILSNSPICYDLLGVVKNEKTALPILFGSNLPFCQGGLIDLGFDRFQYDGKLLVPAPKNDFKFLEKVAKNFLGAPYLWGGKTHFGIDCSGFTQQVFKASGYRLPRDANQQAESGKKIDFENILPGDLAFFTNAQGRVIHVGIVFGKDKIIHASGEIRIDKLDEKGIFNKDRNAYSHKLSICRRIFD